MTEFHGHTLATLLGSNALNLPPVIAGLTVTGLSCDSRTTSRGDLFFALQGARDNGVGFIAEAAAKGAVAVVCREEVPSAGIPLVRVSDAREVMARAASIYHGSPSGALAVAGVTGTNGKTTTAWIIRHLSDAVGRRCGLLGTIRYILPGHETEASRTTPESLDLQAYLAEMRDGGFRAAALEVSSHALVQHRVTGIEFDAAVFTNLTQDHLDYHGTMEEYFVAKAGLFTGLAKQTFKKGRAVINSDCRYGRRLLDLIPSKVPVITYGQGSNCLFRASDIRHVAEGTTFRLDAKGRSYLVRSPLLGIHNVMNMTAALAAVSAMGIELRRAVVAAVGVPQIPGRLERIPVRRRFQCFVDYAHTPDALSGVLRALRQMRGGRIITLFGCGGDRDRSKRPLMAEAAEQDSDHVILTSDNPRGEDPEAILRETARGFRSSRHEIIADREEAIRRAVTMACPGDIVLLAGKGHENYQEIAGTRYPFDDARIATRAMSALASTGEPSR